MEDSEKFKKLVRILHTYLKAHHHLGNIKISDGTIHEPMGLRRVSNTLEATIRPANPNYHTQLMLTGNARNWLHNSLQILEDHYLTTIKETEKILGTLQLDNWEDAWKVAIRWNRRNLKNIKDTTITNTTTKITQFINNLQSTTQKHHATTPAIDPEPNCCDKHIEPIVTKYNPIKDVPLQTTEKQTNNTDPLQSTTIRPDPSLEYQGFLSPELTIYPHPPRACFNLHLDLLSEHDEQPKNYKRKHPDSREPRTDPKNQQSQRSRSTPRRSQTMEENRTSSGTKFSRSEANLAPKKAKKKLDYTIPTGVSSNSTPRKSSQLISNPRSTNSAPPVTTIPTQESLYKGPSTRSRRSNISPNRDSNLNPKPQTVTDQGTTTETTSNQDNQTTPLYTRHEHGGDKYKNFSLNPQRPILFLGASNMQNLPLIKDCRIQVDCFPGAQLSHAYHIIKHKTPTTSTVQKVILNFGLNNRDQRNPSLLTEQLKRMIQAAKATFPKASLYIPVINFNPKLHSTTKQNIETLNFLIRDSGLSIPPLPGPSFSTTWDRIHWTQTTGELMSKHWLKHLN